MLNVCLLSCSSLWNDDEKEVVATPVTYTINISDSQSLIEMASVTGGTFSMGSTSGDSDEEPVHTVTVSNFYIGKYEVTQGQYEEVMGTNPSEFSGSNFRLMIAD